MTVTRAMIETFCAEILRVLIGFLSSDVGAIHLLLQNPDYADEEEKVQLPRELKGLINVIAL